jgi:hypothetical protein
MPENSVEEDREKKVNPGRNKSNPGLINASHHA